MSYYADRIMPRLIVAGMKNKAMAAHRPRIPALATGQVLEVGIGSGLNLPHYGQTVTRLFGLEPSQVLRQAAAEAARDTPFPVELLAAGAEAIPLDSGTIDTVVSTWTLCSIPQLEIALQEIRRVLRPAGTLLFFEHGRSPDLSVSRLQDLLAPLLRGLAGCNPNRQIDTLITGAGFRMVDIQRSYLDGPRFLAWHFVGQAVPT